MRFFYAVDLAMTAVAGHHQHLGAGGPDLVHFSAGVIYSLFVVTRYQGTATATTADLVHFRRIEIDPVLHTLTENPTRFFEKSMSKPLLGSSPVIAGIVIGCRTCKTCFVQLDTSFLDVSDEQIKYRDKFEFFKNLRMVFFKTRPGRKIGMPSFGPQECFDFQSLHLFDDAAAHDFHGRVITGEIGPVGSLPVFRWHGPVFLGRMKDPPPVF